jgi:hypothetical protein
MTPPAVSVLIPVHNGARWLDDVIASIRGQTFRGPVDIIAVEDGSRDGSRAILARHASHGGLTIVEGPRRGATAALNVGIRSATAPLIAQVDQDVVLERAWLAVLVEAMGDPRVAAAQGQYVTPPGAGLWSRVMALDLRLRYTGLRDGRTNHVCTGNSVYRRQALLDVGLFDETLGYGYDNDMSYRLTGAGHSRVYCSGARSAHHWREGFVAYLRQQYGFGYGRLDLVAKHRGRLGGDDVSRLGMMLHAPAMATTLGLLAAGAAGAVAGWSARLPLASGTALAGVLAIERTVAGVRAWRRFDDPAGLLFAPAHLARDLAWTAAMATWLARRVRRASPRPNDSMTPRDPDGKISVRRLP